MAKSSDCDDVSVETYELKTTISGTMKKEVQLLNTLTLFAEQCHAYSKEEQKNFLEDFWGKWNLYAEHGVTLAHMAAYIWNSGLLEKYKTFLSNIDCYGRTPLHYVFQGEGVYPEPQLGVVQYLAKCLSSEVMNLVDCKGFTALDMLLLTERVSKDKEDFFSTIKEEDLSLLLCRIPNRVLLLLKIEKLPQTLPQEIISLFSRKTIKPSSIHERKPSEISLMGKLEPGTLPKGLVGTEIPPGSRIFKEELPAGFLPPELASDYTIGMLKATLGGKVRPAYMHEKGYICFYNLARAKDFSIMKSLFTYYAPTSIEGLIDKETGRTILHEVATTDRYEQRLDNLEGKTVIKKESWMAYILKQPHVRELINYQDKEGNTPLHIAAKLGHEVPIRVLQQVGADVTIMNHQGERALQLVHPHTRLDQSHPSSSSKKQAMNKS